MSHLLNCLFLFRTNSGSAAEGGRRRQREPQTGCEKEEGTKGLIPSPSPPTVGKGGKAVSAAAPPSL